MSLGERLLVACLLTVAACSGSGSVPATTPTTSTTLAETTTMGASTTSVPGSTTTVDRLAEIEAIFQDLEQRRLTALYEGDRAAFSALFANEAYLERSLAVFDQAEFTEAPIADVAIVEVLHDGPDCVAAVEALRYSDAPASTGTIVVLEMNDGVWGFSFAGEGWACIGPHPLDS